MRISHPFLGKILQHAQGLGVPSPDTVRQRAKEDALIEGRPEFNEDDWKRAFRELHGGHHDNGDHNERPLDDEMMEVSSERDMVAPSLGHRTGRGDLSDDHSLGEELVAEGVDEATHEQMLESRRNDESSDEEEEDSRGVSRKPPIR